MSERANKNMYAPIFAFWSVFVTDLHKSLFDSPLLSYLIFLKDPSFNWVDILKNYIDVKFWLFSREELNEGTVHTFEMHNIGTVPAYI